jgi:hypothetical protein
MYDRGQTGGPTLPWRYTRMVRATQRHIAILFLILMTITQSTLATHAVSPGPKAQSLSLTPRAAANSSLLECLEVAPPVLSPSGGCQQTLMEYTFAYSYGQPFVGT